MANYLYKIQNEDGNWFGGFKTEAEAQDALKWMREDKQWRVVQYKADNYELKN